MIEQKKVSPLAERQQTFNDLQPPNTTEQPTATTAYTSTSTSTAASALNCALAASKHRYRFTGRVVLYTVIVSVWMVMAIPSVMFYIPQDQSSESLVTSSESTCSDREVYAGQACRETLQRVQSCYLGNQSNGTIYIASTDGLQAEIEAQAQTLVLYLPLLQPSQECEEAVMPLLCLYLFKLCTGEGNGTIHQPSSQQCSYVSTDVCLTEWSTAQALLDDGTLPDCRTLPDHEQDDLPSCQKSNTNSSNIMSATNTNTNTTSGRLCSDGFFDDGSICQPECGEWEEWSSVTVDTIDGFVIIAAVADVVATAIIFMISCMQHKRMLQYPTSIVFYQSIGLFVTGVLILVAYTDRKALFCSSKSTLTSVYNPTAFCTIIGVVFSYVFNQLMFWWLCHVATIYWTIRFPVHYRAYRKSRKITYVHVAVVVTGLVIPTIPIIVTFATGEFAMTRFPPIACLPDNEDAPFYSIVLPISITMAIGVSLLTLILSHLLEMLQNKERIAQAKILIILVFYISLGVSTLTSFTITRRNFGKYFEELESYFVCESQGTGEPCDTSEFRKYNPPVPPAISFVLLGLIPVVKLCYVIKYQEVKAAYQKWRGQKDKAPDGYSSSTMTTSKSSRTPTSIQMDGFSS